MSKKLFLTILVFLLLFSCKKKDDKLVIKGKITNTTNIQAEPQVTIYLYGKKIDGSTYNANYTTLAKTTSSSSGDYTIEIDRENIDKYKIKLDKKGFFTEENEFTYSSFNDNTYIYNNSITPASYIKINIKNSAPYNNDDYFKYKIIKGYKDAIGACTQTSFYLGTSVNTKQEGRIIGNQENEIEYWIVKNNQTTHSIKKIFCPVNDTAIVNFYY